LKRHIKYLIKIDKSYCIAPFPFPLLTFFCFTEQLFSEKEGFDPIGSCKNSEEVSQWSPAEEKDWNWFVAKTESHFVRFSYTKTKYSPAMYNPVVSVNKE
jgi:hypothetical protein